jgi:hypothetical protein
MRIPWIAIILSLSTIVFSQGKYRFSYTYQADSHGVFLLLFPYRVFLEMNAEIILKSECNAAGECKFYFAGVRQPASLVRTMGFSGKKLAIVYADENLFRGNSWAETTRNNFSKIAPYYANYIKKKLTFPHLIEKRVEFQPVFIRDQYGIHRQCQLNVPVRYVGWADSIPVYFHVFPVMIEMLAAYNHSWLPAGCDLHTIDWALLNGQSWPSLPLDFTDSMNRIGRLIAKVIEKYITFKQNQPLIIEYKAIVTDTNHVEIIGKNINDVYIWGDFKISQCLRKIRLNVKTRQCLLDSFQFEVRNQKNHGGTIHCSLERID